MRAVPGIDLGLEVVANGEKPAVLRPEFADEAGQGLPEAGRLDAGAGQGLVLDEALERPVHRQPGNLNTFSHARPVHAYRNNRQMTLEHAGCPVGHCGGYWRRDAAADATYPCHMA